MEVANSMGLWIIATVMVSLVVIQAVVFMRSAFKNGKKMGITDQQLKIAVRASAITSVGPAFAILIGLVALISLVGSPMAWMRLGIIGAVMFETLAVEAGAQAVGVVANTPEFGLYAFSNVMWVMCLSSIGWLIIVAFLTPNLEKIRGKLVGGKEYLLPILSTGAVLGAFGFQVSKFIVDVGPGTVAVLVSGAFMIAINKISDKTGINWLKEWALGFSMVAGMFSATLIK